MRSVKIYTVGFSKDAVKSIFSEAAAQASDSLGYLVTIHVLKPRLHWFHYHIDGIIFSPKFASMQRRVSVPSSVVDISGANASASIGAIREEIINLAQRVVLTDVSKY